MKVHGLGLVILLSQCLSGATKGGTVRRRRLDCEDATDFEITDEGFEDEWRGWYDGNGCGKCNLYCRWVGESGSGGSPYLRAIYEKSYWACESATSSELILRDHALGGFPTFNKTFVKKGHPNQMKFVVLTYKLL